MIVLVDGIYYRRDIPNAIVDQSNAALQLLVDDYNAISKAVKGKSNQAPHHAYSIPANSNFVVHFVAPSAENQNNISKMLDDHVHFNKKGYSLFA